MKEIESEKGNNTDFYNNEDFEDETLEQDKKQAT